MANGPKNNVAEQLAQLRRDKSAAGMAGLSQQPQGRQQGAFQYAQPKVPPLASSTPSGLTAKRVVKQEPSGTRVASTSTPTVPVKRKAPSSSIQEMIGLTQEVSEKGGGSTRSKGKRKQEEVEEPDDSGFIEIPSIEKKASAAPPQSYRADTVSSTSTLQDDPETIDRLKKTLAGKQKAKETFQAYLLEALNDGGECAAGFTVADCQEKLNGFVAAIKQIEQQLSEAELVGDGTVSRRTSRSPTLERASNPKVTSMPTPSSGPAIASTSRHFPLPQAKARNKAAAVSVREDDEDAMYDQPMDLDDIEEAERLQAASPAHARSSRQQALKPAAPGKENMRQPKEASNRPNSAQAGGFASFGNPRQAAVASAQERRVQAVSGVKTVSKEPENYPWSKDVRKALVLRFELDDFRLNQLQAINATLKGQDVFVLMPTGGGKSICYQLPAVISTGKTKGVTVVVSPLLSLITDQVASLLRKDITVVTLNSTMSATDRRFAIEMLTTPEPSCRLVYVTPELIGNSGQFRDILGSLHRRNRLARFVIDEAHCVSQWGHDLRPDYKQLGQLKVQYPNIPMIALTATANERVKADIVENLNIRGCLTLTQSFNRSNLHYEVRSKSGKVLESIAKFIQEEHAGECGIVYCMSKRACEDTADKLKRDFKIEAHHYHAGMNKDDRLNVQQSWQKGLIKVIVATIAFGMGIDKADVRFVIHQTLPSSLEGYYQETGRAGRDGKPSVCILYYGFNDVRYLRRFIMEGEGTWEQKRCQHSNLNRVIQFCCNPYDCRRTQVLQYFGDTFDPKDCRGTCDNCHKNAGKVVAKTDVTDRAKDIVALVRAVEKQRITLSHLGDVYKGSRNKKVLASGHEQAPGAGKGEDISRTAVDRLLQIMVSEEMLAEELIVNKAGFTQGYIRLGSGCRTLTQGKKLFMHLGTPAEPKAQAAVQRSLKVHNNALQINKVAQRPKKQRNNYIDEEEEEYEEEIRVTRKKITRKQTRQQEPLEVDDDDGDAFVVPDDEDGDEAEYIEVDEDEDDETLDGEDDDEDDDSDIELIRPDDWKIATQGGPQKNADQKPDLQQMVYRELNAVVEEMAIEEDVQCADDFDVTLQTIAAVCPTTVEGFTKIEGFDDDLYDTFGKRFRAITSKYARQVTGKGTTAAPSAQQNKKKAVAAISKKPASKDSTRASASAKAKKAVEQPKQQTLISSLRQQYTFPGPGQPVGGSSSNNGHKPTSKGKAGIRPMPTR